MASTRNLILSVATVGVLGGAVLVGVGIMRDGDGTRSLAGTFNDPAAAQASPTAGLTAAQRAAQERAKRAKALDTALKAYAAKQPEFSVAVLDKKTGQKYSFRGAEEYETASVVKVQVLACLLLTAQGKKRDLTAGELSLAQNMIRNSDNDSTTALFGQLGKQTGVGACNRRLGLTETTVNSAWGLTRTTVDDQVRLLGELVDKKGPLDADSRKVAYTLMSTVSAGQDWGVPAAATTGEKTTVKNGWLARSADNNLYIINTVGRITDADTDVSVAVLSHNNTTEAAGHELVQQVAKMTRQYLRY